MPTLKRRVTDSGTLHPRQTEFYILAKPPDVGNITYQVDQRAVQFLTETQDYGDGSELPWSLVHTLRQIRDLYTLEEGRPRDADPEDLASEHVTVPTLDEATETDLIEYLRSHPDVSGDFGTFETSLKQRDSGYVTHISRDGYTPSSQPGHDETGNETLDRIAQRYYGDAEQDYIEWNDTRVYDYIVVTDRDGDKHRFPEIESRLPEGERLRLSEDIYRRWGPEIGASDVNSRRYEPGEDGFPNRWIGQRTGSPEPSLEQAQSPRAFFYRTLAGRSHYAPGNEAEAAFEDACEYSLEVYKANFPVAVDPRDFQTEYVTVEKATKPWDDFQVPPRWRDEYADTGGLPPLTQETTIPVHFGEAVRAAIDRHTPGGTGSEWFDSITDAVERFGDEFYRDVLLAADQSHHPVLDFSRGGAAQPVFDVKLDSTQMTVVVDLDSCLVTIESTIDGTHTVRSENTHIVSWDVPETISTEETHRVLEEQSQWFEDVAQFVETVMVAMEA